MGVIVGRGALKSRNSAYCFAQTQESELISRLRNTIWIGQSLRVNESPRTHKSYKTSTFKEHIFTK